MIKIKQKLLFYINKICILCDAALLVEPCPGCGPLLAPVADRHPPGDSVALRHFAHACTQLSHVSPVTLPLSSLLINTTYTYS